MATQVDICNLALTKVGAQRITTIADGTEEADLCSLFYDIVRDDVLRAYPWNFALARSSNLTATTTPEFEYSYAYTLPSDCLRVLKINDWDENFVVEGSTLLTEKASGVQILYIKQEDTEANWTSQFVMVFATRLAAEISAKLTGSIPERTAALWQEYANLLPMATVADGYENDPEYDDICKLALGKIQANRQKSWESDPIAEARACNVFYADVRDAVTAEYPWNFAVTRSDALVAATAPTFGYSNAWTLPTDCLRVLEMSDSDEKWEVEGTTLVTDATDAPKVRYIAQVTSGFPSNFKVLVATRLAAEVTGRLDPQAKEAMWQEYQGLLLAAQITDGFEQDRDYTKICNMALGKLDIPKQVTSATDTEKETRLCNTFYEDVRDEVLMALPWNFAIGRVSIDVDDTAPEHSYDYRFAVPTDSLRVLRVWPEDGSDGSHNRNHDCNFEVEGGYILTNDESTTIDIIYIKQITTITSFTQPFIKALSARLAAELALPLVGQVGVQDRMYALYQMELDKGMELDAIEGFQKWDHTDGWITARA